MNMLKLPRRKKTKRDKHLMLYHVHHGKEIVERYGESRVNECVKEMEKKEMHVV